jgi:membrane fusion protein, copper/silver efflux system
MKTKIKINKREIRIIVIAVIAGLLIGWLFFHSSGRETKSNQTATESAEKKPAIWTCSMHPQIRMDHPGKCPICGMDLIPLSEYSSEESAVSPDDIQMSEEALKIADVQTMVVRKAYPDKEIYLLGKVQPDERNIAELTARYGGRIEKLYINFTGQRVKEGEKLASVYSPALVSGQMELLETISYKESNPELYRAARSKLKLWGLSNRQIESIEKEGKPMNYFDVLSPITGTVTRRDVSVGDYIKEGSPLFQIVDLSKVWIMFEAYESDLPWIKMNDKVNFTIRSIPGRNFTGRVSFIDPTINPKTRVAHVRVEVPNAREEIKPEMFVNGVVTSSIAGNKKDLLIPKTAILWTGKRSVVYFKVADRNQPTFRHREITLGPEAGDFYVVANGLKEGEEIAVNGVFKIDAAAQLAGKPSMMNPEGGGGSAGGMAGMNMGQGEMGKAERPTEKDKNNNAESNYQINPEFIKQLTAVYEAYLPMKNDFVQSDAGKAGEAAKTVLNSLNKVNMELLKGEAHLEWMEYLNALKKSLDQIAVANNIEIQRQGFADFNLNFYKAIKRFGLVNDTVYFQYCPMAFNNKGAYWLSDILKIRNPYFGDVMLSCGETRDTLRYDK